MRHTRSHTANRRSHHAISALNLATCQNCGAKHRPHHMCLDCGFYKGRMVVDLAAKKESRDARLKAKQEAIKEQQPEPAKPAVAEKSAAKSEEKAEVKTK